MRTDERRALERERRATSSSRRGSRRPRDEDATATPRSAAFQALLQDRRKLVRAAAPGGPADRRRSTCCSRRSSASTTPSSRLDDATWYWIVVAIGFNVVAFAAYVALFRGVLGGAHDRRRSTARLDWRASYQITMAGLAATRIFSAAGAGGHRAHLLGAAQGRACRAGARPAAWSPSSR